MKLNLLFILIVLVAFSCNKDHLFDTNRTSDSFQRNSNNNDRSIIININSNSFIDFVHEYFEKIESDLGKGVKSLYGTPMWNFGRDHSQYHSEGYLAFIPFEGKKGNEVSAVLVAFKGNNSDLVTHLAERKHLNKYKSKNDLPRNGKGKHTELSYEMLAGLFLYFENQMYDKVDCELLASLNTNNSRDYVCNIEWYEVTECYCSSAGGVVSCYDCSTTIEYEEACSAGNGGVNIGSSSGSTGIGDFYIPICKKSFDFQNPLHDADIWVAKMRGPNTLDGQFLPTYCWNTSIIEIPTSLGADPSIQFTSQQARWLAAKALNTTLKSLVGSIDLTNCYNSRNEIASTWEDNLRKEAASLKGISRYQQKLGYLNGLRVIIKNWGDSDYIYPEIDPSWPEWELDRCIKNHNLN